MLKVKEVADMLRVSAMTVYRMVESGELEHTRVRRSIRIPLAAVEALQNRKEEA